jgi:hypothetical protein
MQALIQNAGPTHVDLRSKQSAADKLPQDWQEPDQ